MRRAPPPAPWVYSPDDSAYLALSEKMTMPKRHRFHWSDNPVKRGMEGINRPMQAKVMSTTSHHNLAKLLA